MDKKCVADHLVKIRGALCDKGRVECMSCVYMYVVVVDTDI